VSVTPARSSPKSLQGWGWRPRVAVHPVITAHANGIIDLGADTTHPRMLRCGQLKLMGWMALAPTSVAMRYTAGVDILNGFTALGIPHTTAVGWIRLGEREDQPQTDICNKASANVPLWRVRRLPRLSGLHPRNRLARHGHRRHSRVRNILERKSRRTCPWFDYKLKRNRLRHP